MLQTQNQWNGTSWTEVNDLSTARRGIRWSRSTNSSFSFWRILQQLTVANTESWNGSSWTEVNDLNTDKILVKVKELKLLL
jgi:hypothetical protein